jgi:hypothetical protein
MICTVANFFAVVFMDTKEVRVRVSVRLGAKPLETHGQNFFHSVEHLQS